jgi:hypothetical protein
VKNGDDEPPPRLPRRRILLDPCAYLRPTDHAVLIYRGLMMCHTLGFVQIRQTGVLFGPAGPAISPKKYKWKNGGKLCPQMKGLRKKYHI